MSPDYTKLQQYLGRKLKQYRQHKNMSLEQLGEKAGLDSTNIGRLERGEKLPALITYFKLLDSLKIEQSDYFDDMMKLINIENAKRHE